jgi:hypothetical protein
VRLPKKFNVHLGQKVPLVFACFQVSAPPRLETLDSDKKDALFGLDTQITILLLRKINLTLFKTQQNDQNVFEN